VSAPAPQTRDFFIYRQRNGTPAIVDTLSRVPKHGEESLRIVTLPKQENEEPFLDPRFLEEILAAPKDTVNQVVARYRETREQIHVAKVADGLDPTSVLLGAAVGFGIGVIAARLFRAPGWVIKIGLLLVATTLGGGLYYGWLRAHRRRRPPRR